MKEESKTSKQIPVHRMDDWLSGVYLKPAGVRKTALTTYDVGQPHRHDFYYCVLLEKGTMELEVDFQKIHLKDHSLFISYPGQIHQINSARMTRGWFFAVDPAILDQLLKGVFDQSLAEIMLVPLSKKQLLDFSSSMDDLYRVYTNPAQMFHQPITHALVSAILFRFASAYLSIEKKQLVRYSTRSIEITKTFRQLLRQEHTSLQKPSGFASRMSLTTTYLNDTVRSVTGFPVTYHIQQESMREAQRLLYYSDLPVRQIAFSLGFEDEKYFNRLFRKIVGVPPGAFRKRER